MMFLLFPLLLGLIIYYSIVDARAAKRRHRRKRQFMFHSDGKSSAEITSELRQQFAPTKGWR